MKKLLLFCALIVAATTTFAQTNPYSVTLAQAVWNFNEGDPTAPSLSSENFPIPANCFDATGGSARTPSSAYLPYIKPGLLQDQTEKFGYNGEKYALYFGTANNPTTRMPSFMMFPTISDAAYTNLELQFYARQENATAQRLKIGYIADMSGIDQSTHKFSGTINHVATLTLTATYSLQKVALATVPAGAYVVLYADITEAAAEYFYIDDIKFATKSSSTPEPENPTVTYNLTHCTGAAENPTEVDNENIFEAVFTLEDGYEWGTPEVTIGGVAIPDMLVDFEADPAYYADIDGNTMTLQIIAGDDIEEDVVITLVCTEAQQAVTPIPGAATFEEYLDVLPELGDKYNPYNADGTHYWQSGDYTFSCTRSWGGMMNDGFYPANYSDTNYVSYVDDYKALPCAGANGSSAYCSMYYGGSYGGPCTITFSERTLTGTYVVLALNPYICMHGRSWCDAFTDGDYLLLRLSGKKNGVYTNTHVDFYLADYRDGKQIEITDWTWLDLSSLGAVDEIEVTMSDSQNGAGIGDYACFDNFGGTAIPTAITKTTAAQARKMMVNGQLIIRRGNACYTITGAKK